MYNSFYLFIFGMRKIFPSSKMGYIRRNEASRSREASQRLSLGLGLFWGSGHEFDHFGPILEGLNMNFDPFESISGLFPGIDPGFLAISGLFRPIWGD